MLPSPYERAPQESMFEMLERMEKENSSLKERLAQAEERIFFMQADALTAEAEAVHAVSTKLKALESQLSFKDQEMFRMQADYASMKSKFEHDLKAQERSLAALAQAAATSAAITTPISSTRNETPAPSRRDSELVPASNAESRGQPVLGVQPRAPSSKISPVVEPSGESLLSVHGERLNVAKSINYVLSIHASLHRHVFELKVITDDLKEKWNKGAHELCMMAEVQKSADTGVETPALLNKIERRVSSSSKTRKGDNRQDTNKQSSLVSLISGVMDAFRATNTTVEKLIFSPHELVAVAREYFSIIKVYVKFLSQIVNLFVWCSTLDTKSCANAYIVKIVHGLDTVGSKCLKVLAALVSDIPVFVLAQYEQTRESYRDVSKRLSLRHAPRTRGDQNSSLAAKGSQAKHHINVRKRLFTDCESELSNNSPADRSRDPYDVLPAPKVSIVNATSIDPDDQEKEDSIQYVMTLAVSDGVERLLRSGGAEAENSLGTPWPVPRVDAEVRKEINDATLAELHNCLAQLLSFILDQNICNITRRATILSMDSQIGHEVLNTICALYDAGSIPISSSCSILKLFSVDQNLIVERPAGAAQSSRSMLPSDSKCDLSRLSRVLSTLIYSTSNFHDRSRFLAILTKLCILDEEFFLAFMKEQARCFPIATTVPRDCAECRSLAIGVPDSNGTLLPAMSMGVLQICQRCSSINAGVFATEPLFASLIQIVKKLFSVHDITYYQSVDLVRFSIEIIRSLIRLVDYRGQKVSVIVLGYEYDMNFDETSNLIDGSPSRGRKVSQDTPDSKRKRGRAAKSSSVEAAEDRQPSRESESTKAISYSSTVLNQVIQICELGMDELDRHLHPAEGRAASAMSSLVSEIICLLVSVARLCGKRFKAVLLRHSLFKQLQSLVYRLWTHRCHPSLLAVRDQAGYLGSEIS